MNSTLTCLTAELLTFPEIQDHVFCIVFFSAIEQMQLAFLSLSLTQSERIIWYEQLVLALFECSDMKRQPYSFHYFCNFTFINNMKTPRVCLISFTLGNTSISEWHIYHKDFRMATYRYLNDTDQWNLWLGNTSLSEWHIYQWNLWPGDISTSEWHIYQWRLWPGDISISEWHIYQWGLWSGGIWTSEWHIYQWRLWSGDILISDILFSKLLPLCEEMILKIKFRLKNRSVGI